MSKTKIKASLARDVLNRDGRRCQWCGKDTADGIKLHIDHVLAEAFGGDTTYENLGTLCDSCNLAKSYDYFGTYLLTTLIKVKNLDSYIHEEDFGTGFVCSLKIYLIPRGLDTHVRRSLRSVAKIPDSFIPLEGDTLAIRRSEARKAAKIELKNKLRDFLFENQGYLKEEDNKLVFEEKKFPSQEPKTL